MVLFGRGVSQIPYHMFDVARDAEAARRLDRCERIYHRGQDLAWSGEALLKELVARHGGVYMADPARRAAVERIFAIIFWGELAAWKISLQLADALEPLEAKMAATSQAHDEARHVGLGMQYLPELVKGMTRLEVRQMLLFQARLLFWALWEATVLDPHFQTLGVPTRQVVDLARAKQAAALEEAFDVLGEGYAEERRSVLRVMGSAAAFLFPEDRAWSIGGVRARFATAWDAFWRQDIDRGALDVHFAHPIRTARGVVAGPEGPPRAR